MFKKLVVVDAKGHLLGRLASYIAKTLLSGRSYPMQGNELLSFVLKASTSLVLSSETRSNFQSSYESDSSLTLAGLSFITVHLLAFSGELLEACCPIKLLEELRHLEDSKFLKAFQHPMIPRSVKWSLMP